MNFSKFREWVNINSRRIILAGLGFLLIGAGVFWWKSGGVTNENEGVKILSSETEILELVVDVEGAVARPGVYKLKSGSRIVDAINIAAGFSEDADVNWVEKNLNRSAKVSDGMKIYIPRFNGEKGSGMEDDRININTAGVGELDKLPGVGEVTAEKIISGRPYIQAEEMMQRKIVSQKVWEQIKNLVSTW